MPPNNTPEDESSPRPKEEIEAEINSLKGEFWSGF